MTTWRATSTLTGERPRAWQDMAACKDALTSGVVTPAQDPFFPGSDKRLAAIGQAYCRACPVMLQCELERKAARMSEGVWAGRHHEPPRTPSQIAALRAEPKQPRKGGLYIHAGRREAYDRGLTDNQIAALENCSPNTIGKWRNTNRLPANSYGGTDVVRRQELYDDGLSDREIGYALNCSRASVQSWRRREALPANPDPESTVAKQRDPVRDARRTEMYAQGMTDKEVAISENITTDSAKSWRERRGIEVVA